MTSAARDVVVIGGGIIGCMTAYLLARSGATVTILEADSVGSHASGFAFGEMGALEGAGIPDPLLGFSVWSHQRHVSLAAELQEVSGVDPIFHLGARIKLALQLEEASDYKKSLEWQKDIADFKARWLDAEDIVKAEPQANPDCLGGVYSENAGSVEPYRYTLAAAQAAEKLGVEMVLRRARGLIKDGGRCLGVQVDGGQINAGAVALAMGPWTGQAAEWCKTPDLEPCLPVTPLKGQILRLQHASHQVKSSIYYKGSYVSSKPDGLIWAGTTEEEVGFDEETTGEARDKIMHDLLAMAPALADAELVRQTACLRPLSADGMPIVGRVPGWENLYVGTGAGRKGILWSSGMTQGLADIILGTKSEVPGLDALDPERFQ